MGIVARIAFVTAGNMGLGHLARGIALRRALKRLGRPCDFALFAPPQRSPLPECVMQENIRFVPIIEKELRDRDAAGESELYRELHQFQPHLLLVDLFWAPLFHIVPRLGIPAWLLVRKVPGWWWRVNEHTVFDPAQYARIFAIEPFDLPINVTQMDPIVICNRNECSPPEELARGLGLNESEAVNVIVHSGSAREQEILKAKASSYGSPRVLREFPACTLLGGARRIMAGCGYNTFWEAKWLGYFNKCEFTPFPRGIDDQEWRLAQCSHIEMVSNGADKLAREMLDLPVPGMK